MGARYAAQVTLQEVIDYSPNMRAAFARAPLDDEQQFLRDSVTTEHKQGWASAMLTEDQVNKRIPEGWASIPTFCHNTTRWQKGRINNGRAPKHNKATEYTETTTMCTAFHPAMVMRLLCATAVALRYTCDRAGSNGF